MKTLIKWCRECEAATEHDSWDSMKGGYMDVCLKCYEKFVEEDWPYVQYRHIGKPRS
jgi:hypothetical protein